MLAADLDHDVRPTPLAEALASVRQQLSLIVGDETVPLNLAAGRVLAGNLVADVDLPPTDNSAVDGFALRAADLVVDGTRRLRIVGEAAAGRPFAGHVERGQAIRIYTGAPLPSGADTVMMVECCAVNGDVVDILKPFEGKANWRRRGEDVKRHSAVLPAGRRLRTKDIALAGALGCEVLPVFRRLQVALFSTGDELCEPGQPLRDGQIWDANRSFLRGMLVQMGCAVQDLGIMPDQPRALETAFSRAAASADLLVTSGGMSVGNEDHIRPLIRRRGTLDIWRLAIRPGKPVGLGDIDACTILALPGNPIAAVVAMMAVGRTVVDRLAGATEEMPLEFRLPAACSFKKRKGMRQYLLGTIGPGPGGGTAAMLHDKQGSAMLSTMAASSGFIVLDEDCSGVEPGDLVSFVPTDALLG